MSKEPKTGNPEADAMTERAWLYRKMADDLRAQAAQLLYPAKITICVKETGV